jgi:hypothetical protein
MLSPFLTRNSYVSMDKPGHVWGPCSGDSMNNAPPWPPSHMLTDPCPHLLPSVIPVYLAHTPFSHVYVCIIVCNGIEVWFVAMNCCDKDDGKGNEYNQCKFTSEFELFSYIWKWHISTKGEARVTQQASSLWWTQHSLSAAQLIFCIVCSLITLNYLKMYQRSWGKNNILLGGKWRSQDLRQDDSQQQPGTFVPCAFKGRECLQVQACIGNCAFRRFHPSLRTCDMMKVLGAEIMNQGFCPQGALGKHPVRKGFRYWKGFTKAK